VDMDRIKVQADEERQLLKRVGPNQLGGFGVDALNAAQLGVQNKKDMFKGGGIAGGFGGGGVHVGGPIPAERPGLPTIVREYAHRHEAADRPELRADFTETLYWTPVLVLPGGKAEVSFDLCDSVTTFEVTAYGHTGDGRLGASTARIDSRLPLS